MIDTQVLTESFKRTAAGIADLSGKTPLDTFVELARTGESPATDGELANAISSLAGWFAEQGPAYLRLMREFIRRLKLRDEALAAILRRLVKDEPTRSDVDRRRWTSLALMDLGFPPTVTALQRDDELRKRYVGDWLSLVAANRNYSSVENAFVVATKEGIVSVKQLCLKAEVVRRQFGERLANFLLAVALALPDEEQRIEFRNLILKMYGYDLNDEPHGTVAIENLGWLDRQTINLLERVNAEAELRKLKEAA